MSERHWKDWELVCLRLLRQLPRDNPVRRHAEDFVANHGSGIEGVLRKENDPELALPFNVCPKCGREMSHFRLKGYRCASCD